MTINFNKEKDTVRELAHQVAQIAASPENEQIIKRWCDTNARRKPDRAPVWCKPVGAWKEILPDESLQCTEPYLQAMEKYFRKILIKRDINDDTPVDPYFPVPAQFDIDPPNVWGVDISRHKAPDEGGAWAYDPPLRTEADLDKLRLPVYTYNKEGTGEELSKAQDILGDTLPVKLVCSAPLGATLCTYAAELIGLNDLMINLIDKPDLMHRLMAYLRDAVLGAMNQVEETGLLRPNNNAPMTCSDPVGPDPGDGPLTYKNMWTMANSQEFDQVSPAMWEEFLLKYQTPVIEQFGLSSYGCCESLTHKIDGVLSIPNLRIFVCSAWSDLDAIINRAGKDHVIMWREKATRVVVPDKVDKIKSNLEENMKKLQGYHYQIILRELQTLMGHRDRLHEWTEIAKEAAAKYA